MKGSYDKEKVWFVIQVLFIVGNEYVREIFSYLHKIIVAMPQETFIFIMYVALAIIIATKDLGKH